MIGFEFECHNESDQYRQKPPQKHKNVLSAENRHADTQTCAQCLPVAAERLLEELDAAVVFDAQSQRDKTQISKVYTGALSCRIPVISMQPVKFK